MQLSRTAELTEVQPDFETLFLAHWPEIHRLLYGMLGDEAEDAAQEVFLKLHTRPPTPGSNIRAWLYKVASREGLDRLRSRRRRDGLLGRLRDLVNATHEPGPQDDLGRHDEQRAVRELLGKMRPAYAQVLLLRHEGLSYSDIAEATGLSRNSVGAMLLRAERQFVKLHNQAGGEEV